MPDIEAILLRILVLKRHIVTRNTGGIKLKSQQFIYTKDNLICRINKTSFQSKIWQLADKILSHL